MRIFLFIIALSTTFFIHAQKPTQKWLDQKYSMFIHFGLYSAYGGVYDGKPVTRGYSEQIQSFAGIFSDWYAESAKSFNPTAWDADEIATLAKNAGMRSIVLTSKHHDGFCMYHSLFTKFNIVDATPYKRDLMKELSEACKRAGIDFAVYFSLIDWNFPQAYPISSHNADPISPEHHQFNLRQVEEIMTNYGPISEIWFDMGSLTTAQSKELYELVNRLQPQCMISGRLGNNQVDFSVMADNEYPDYKLSVPWQTASSMFNETWGYRSWQERGSVEEKVNEKISSLVNVISRGGNYLLNIGPRGDGSVVEFEQEVLLKMGNWIDANREAIYETQANPFPYTFGWGDITTKNNNLYLFVKKGNNDINLSGFSGKIAKVEILSTGEKCRFTQNSKSNSAKITIPTNATSTPFSVLKVSFKNKFSILPAEIIKTGLLTSWNAVPEFGHSGLDYYCGYKSLTGYSWNFQTSKKTIKPEISFSENNVGKNIVVSIDGVEKVVTLNPSENERVDWSFMPEVKLGNIYKKRGSGVFGYVAEENQENVDISDWERIVGFKYGEKMEMELSKRGSVLFLQEIETKADRSVAVEIGSGNGVYILLNGKYITAHCLPERPDYQKEIVILPLKKGKNQLLIKFFNRFADNLQYSINPLTGWINHTMKLPEFKLNNSSTHQLSIKEADPDSKVSPLRMNNVVVRW